MDDISIFYLRDFGSSTKKMDGFFIWSGWGRTTPEICIVRKINILVLYLC